MIYLDSYLLVYAVEDVPVFGAATKQRLARAACTERKASRPMPIELPKDTRAQAVASIERWFREHMDEPIGNVAAGGLLGFFLEEIGPSIYNQAVADVQERLQARVAELDIEVHEDEFGYWRKFDARRKGRG